ncbi:MAG: GNAT family N-acetyltransferase [Armatimonadetes bacterium]|nr:GNAT family N-acetyltransferase [Armatimonadota bacterium]
MTPPVPDPPSVVVEAAGYLHAVTLREVSGRNVRALCDLSLKPGQERFVAPNALSLAEAHYMPNTWVRAVYAGETPVGLVLLDDDPEEPYYSIWRMMIAADHQGKGYGRKAVAQIIEYVRGRPNATELLASYNQGEGNPAPFYRKLGFVETGEMDHGQPVMRFSLQGQSQEQKDDRPSDVRDPDSW